MNQQRAIETLRTYLTIPDAGKHNAKYSTITETMLEELAAALALQEDGNWVPDRWWRVVYADGSRYPTGHYLEGQRHIWCETSDEAEARAAIATCPGGGQLQRLHVMQTKVWSDEQ